MELKTQSRKHNGPQFNVTEQLINTLIDFCRSHVI